MRTILGIILATTTFQAFAVTVNAVAPSSVPEPGALSLLGIGAVAGLLIRAKQRNKKK